MKALPVDDKLKFMKCLLMSDTFDSFLLCHGSITTSNTYEVDGKVNKDFYGTDYDQSPLFGYEYTPWKEIKGWALTLIKGKYTPIAFKFIMLAGDSMKEEVLSRASAEAGKITSSLSLTIRYDEQGLTLITGTAASAFSMDRTADDAWDTYISDFIRDKL